MRQDVDVAERKTRRSTTVVDADDDDVVADCAADRMGVHGVVE